jgi:hypothetical protein
MAESFYDPNLMAEQQRNATQSTAGFDAFIKERQGQRDQYEKSKQEREQMISVAEGLAEHFAPKGESAPAYIAKFLKKAESNGGVQQLSSQDIGKFLGMHQTIAKQQEFETGQADKASGIALRGAQIRASDASIPNAQASTKALTDKNARDQAEFDQTQALRKFLNETSLEDVGPQSRTVTKPLGAGVDKPRFKDPRTGQMVEIDPSSYSEMGLDENGLVVNKDVFAYVSSLNSEDLSRIIGQPIEPSAEANINSEINGTRKRWKDVVGLEPEAIFDKGGTRKDLVGLNGQTTKEKPFHENVSDLIKAINNNPRVFQGGVPRTYKGKNITGGMSWTGQGNKTTLTASEVDTLQEYVVDTLQNAGYDDLATVGTLIKGQRGIQKQNDTNALQFEKKMVTEQVEQKIDDEAVLASIRYEKVAERWKSQGLPPPLPRAAYIAASVPETSRVIPEVDEYGRPNGRVKTYLKMGEKWELATAAPAGGSAVDIWKETEAAAKTSGMTFVGKYANIEVNGRATAIFDEKGVSNLAEVLSNNDTFATGMDTLKELYRDSGLLDRINPASTVNANIEGLITQLQPMVRPEVLGTGVITQPDQDKMDDLFRHPKNAKTWFNNEANLQAFERVKNILHYKAITLLNKHKVVGADGSVGFKVSQSSDKGRAKALELLAVNQQGYQLTPADTALIQKYNPNFGR